MLNTASYSTSGTPSARLFPPPPPFHPFLRLRPQICGIADEECLYPETEMTDRIERRDWGRRGAIATRYCPSQVEAGQGKDSRHPCGRIQSLTHPTMWVSTLAALFGSIFVSKTDRQVTIGKS